MRVIPCTLGEANAFIERYHRHHGRVRGHKFSIAVEKENAIVGVATVGRPVSRMLDDGWTLEVNRCCSDGTRNVCSMLYSAAWRAVKALGYLRLITYILDSEHGSSLTASNWRRVGECGGGTWARTDRPRVDKHPTQGKILWEAA